MIYKLLTCSAIFVGIYNWIIIKSKASRIILALLISSVLLISFSSGFTNSIGSVLYAFSLLLIIVYALAIKDITKNKRMIIIASCIPVLISHVFLALNLPLGAQTGFMMLLPLAIYAGVVVTNPLYYVNELGFLTILAADAIIKLSIAFEWLSS